jgi:histidinol-phosphate aminotransferase
MIKVPLNETFDIDMEKVIPLLSDEKLKIIFICSPNNPTGNCFNQADIEFLITSFRGIVVIDEAYIDFSSKPSFTRLIRTSPNLIVMQTFSKALGLASVRIGMAFTNPDIIQYFNKVKPPYNISSVNQKTAMKMLSSRSDNRSQIERIVKERDRLVSNLENLMISEKVYPSDANFILVKITNATSVYNYLVSRHIIVRNRSSVIDDCLRITVGKKSENDELLKALKSINK